MEYLVDRLLPRNEFSILAGTAGTGKTSLYSWLIKQIQTQTELFEHTITNKPSFYGVLIMDRPCAGHKLWFELAGVEPNYFSFVDSTEPVGWIANSTISGRLETLERLLERVGGEEGPPPPGALLIVDPFALFAGGDSNNYNKVFPHLILLQRMAAVRQWTIIGVMHGGKQKGKAEDRYVRAQDRLLGSQAFLGCSSTVMYLSDVEESGTGEMELCIAPHHAPRMSIPMMRTEDGLVVPKEKEAELTESHLSGSVMTIYETIPLAGEIERGELTAILVGGKVMGKSTLSEGLARLKQEGLVEEHGGRWRRAAPGVEV